MTVGMETSRACGVCGTPLSHGLCPRCLITVGISDSDESDGVPGSPSLLGRVGDYELLEEIGRGGMGIVYRARQVSLDRLVAVKVLPFGGLGGPEVALRLRAEAVAAGSLRHPNIVAIHEVGLHHGQHFLVMDLVAGPSLAEVLRNGPLPAKSAAELVRKVALAVQHAHERGIIHRDLKPSNILIDPVEDEPRITDFGLAKNLRSDTQLTLTGQTLGSPNYIPPEQIRSRPREKEAAAAIDSGDSANKQRPVTSSPTLKVSFASDVYSLGAILYHALTGRPPFVGDDISAVLHQVLEEEPVGPRRLNPSIPEDLETICLKCLEKSGDRRYSTARELANDVERFLKHEPIKARAVGVMGKAWRWCQRNPALAIAYSLLVLSLLGILIGSPIAAFRFNKERMRAEDASRKAEDASQKNEAEVYTSDMSVVQNAWEKGDSAKAHTLLDAHMPRKGATDLRGFEWYYLKQLCHDESRIKFTNFTGWARVVIASNGVVVASDDHKVILLDPVTRIERQVVTDPDSNMGALAVSPVATNIVATAGNTGTISFWDVRTGQLLHSIKTESPDIGSIDFSPNGEFLAWAGAAETFQHGLGLVDAKSGTALWSRITDLPSRVVRFCPDGKLFISGGGAIGRPIMWDLEGNATEFPLEHGGWVQSLAISKDGRKLATTADDSTTIVWDIPTRSKQHRFETLTGIPALSPDGGLLAIAAWGSIIQIWDIVKEKQIALMRGQDDSSSSIAFSEDSRSLVSASGPAVRIWSLEPHESSEVLRAHTNYVVGVAISPDSQRLASVDYFQKHAKIWDLASRKVIFEPAGSERNSEGCAFSPDGRLFALGNDDCVKISETSSFQLVKTLTNVLGTRLSFRPDNSIIAVGGAHLGQGKNLDLLSFWSLPSGTRINKPGIQGTNSAAVQFSPDGKRVAVGYFDGMIRVWDFAHETLVDKAQQHNPGCVWAVAFSPDGRWVASGSEDWSVALYDLETHQGTRLQEHRGTVWMVKFTPDGKSMVSSSGDSTIKFWNLITHRTALTVKGGVGAVNDFAFNRDGILMASCNADGTVHLWPAPRTGQSE